MLRLGARRFRIQVCEVITDPETGQPAPDSGGMFSGEASLIQIAQALSASKMDENACHEILHSWFHMINHGLTDDEEERIVSALTPWFHAFLVQNPELVGQIIEGGVCGDD